MPKPRKGERAAKDVAKEFFETNKKLTRSKAINEVIEITGLSRNYAINLYSSWEGKKKETEKPKNILCLELFENNHSLSREKLLNKVMSEIGVTKGYAINLYNEWHDDTPVKPKHKESVYIPKYKGRTREKFVFDDNALW